MVSLCFSEPLMMKSSANLRLERFALESRTASVTPWSRIFDFSAIALVMHFWSGSSDSVLSGSSPSLEVEVFAFDVRVH